MCAYIFRTIGVYEENKQLKNDIAHLDNYNRRSNIIVRGIPEKYNESDSMCEGIMRSFLKNKVGMMSSLGQQNLCDPTDWEEGLMEVNDVSVLL